MSASKKSNGDRRDITIGDTKFKPGRKGIVELPIGSLIDYQQVTMTVHVRRGKKDGPCLLITAGLHGDEINGIEVVRRLLKSRLLAGLRGDLIAVPVLNTPAYLSRSRYLPDRRDLNRLFPGTPKGSLGGRLAHVFTNEVMAHCTHAIDMHTGAVRRPNLPQLRVTTGDEVGFEMANAFAPPVVMDSPVREGSLRGVYHQNGKPSILYEAGEAHQIDASAVRYGFRGIISVMRHLEMLPPPKKEPKRKPKTVVSPSSGWVRAPRGGIFAPTADLGNGVVKNTVLGIVADPFGRHETKILAASEGVVIGVSREATVDEGDGLFHIATFHSAEKAEAHIQHSDLALEAPATEEEFPGDIQ